MGTPPTILCYIEGYGEADFVARPLQQWRVMTTPPTTLSTHRRLMVRQTLQQDPLQHWMLMATTPTTLSTHRRLMVRQTLQQDPCSTEGWWQLHQQQFCYIVSWWLADGVVHLILRWLTSVFAYTNLCTQGLRQNPGFANVTFAWESAGFPLNRKTPKLSQSVGQFQPLVDHLRIVVSLESD